MKIEINRRIITIFLSLVFTSVNSQTREEVFEKEPEVYIKSSFFNPDGVNILPNVLIQDRDGFLWIGTSDGLYKYDGQKSLRIPSSLDIPDALEGKNIIGLHQDKQGKFWIGTNENCLQRYNPSLDEFTSYKKMIVGLNPQSKYHQFFTFLESDDDRLYMSGPAGTFYFDYKKDSLFYFSQVQCPELLHGTKENLWALAAKSIVKFNARTGEVVSELPFNHYHKFSNGPNVSMRNKDEIYIGNKNKIMLYNLNSDAVTEVQDFGDEFIVNLVADSNYVYLLTNKAGLYKAVKQVGNFDLVTRSDDLQIVWSRNRRDAIYTKNGELLFQFENGRLAIVCFSRGFQTYQIKRLRPAYAREAHYFLDDGQMHYFSYRGLIPILTDSSTWRTPDFGFTVNPDWKSGLEFYYQEDNNSRWFSYHHKKDNGYGLYVVEAQSNMPRLILKDSTTKHSNIFHIGPNQNGGVIVGVNPLQLLSFENATEPPELLYTDTSRAVICNSLIIDHLSRIWIPTFAGGIIQIDPSGNSTIFSQESNEHTLSSNRVECVFQDSDNRIWVGTANGLCLFNEHLNSFKTFNKKHGFPEQVIKSIEEDDFNRLWLSTSNYIVRFDPASLQVNTYSEVDGVRMGIFRGRKSLKDKNGKILFGQAGAFTIVDPEQADVQSKTEKLIFTELKLFNQTVVPGDSFDILHSALNVQRDFTLNHRQNNIAFQFSQPAYKNERLYRFSYRLKGQSDQWRDIGNNKEITFTNLDPGSYTLDLRSAYGSGSWIEEPNKVYFTVNPPWYWSLWSKIAYALAALFAGYGLFKFLLQRQREQQETLQLRQLDELKTKLYTNVTHEFRSPLTVILGMSDRIKDHFDMADEVRFEEGRYLIRRNGKRLLSLVDQMLELGKLDAGFGKNIMIQVDVIQFINYMVESFHSLASDKGIQFVSRHTIGSLVMDTDEDALQKILTNLLSNAIKFSKINEEILISTKSTDGHLEIEIQDFGEGIPAEDLPHIFDRFYKVDEQRRVGTGVGLALTRELVRKLNGEIHVESQENQGSCFIISLPITNQAPLSENSLQLQSPSIETGLKMNITAGDADQPLVLLIEDNEEVAHYIAQCLENDYSLLYAKNGQEGIDQALEQIPDFIISDVMMPLRSGFEVTNELKNDIRTSHIPIILLTAKASSQSRIEGLKMGADAYLTKPFDKEELLVRMEQLIALRLQLRNKYLNQDVDSEDEVAISASKEDEFIKELRHIINTNLLSDLSVSMLCQKIGMSRSQLHRKLTALTGLTTTQFIRSVRFQVAKDLLRDPSLTIAEVAYETGFKTPSYFSRMFAKEVGISPSEFRDSNIRN